MVNFLRVKTLNYYLATGKDIRYRRIVRLSDFKKRPGKKMVILTYRPDEEQLTQIPRENDVFSDKTMMFEDYSESNVVIDGVHNIEHDIGENTENKLLTHISSYPSDLSQTTMPATVEVQQEKASHDDHNVIIAMGKSPNNDINRNRIMNSNTTIPEDIISDLNDNDGMGLDNSDGLSHDVPQETRQSAIFQETINNEIDRKTPAIKEIKPKGEIIPIKTLETNSKKQSSGIICSSCGEIIEQDSIYCPHCGIRLK